MSTPNRTLSKGTMGLKFMNRVQPTALISEPTPSAPSTPTANNANTKIKVEITEPILPIASTSTTPYKHQIVQETSLLSFPLLSSSYSKSASTMATSTKGVNDYSSMPWTQSVVSGRRSFGGANLEIEQLNHPELVKVVVKEGKQETQYQKNEFQKKRKMKEESSSINLSNNGMTGKREEDTAFQSNRDEIKLSGKGSDKKIKRESQSQSQGGGGAAGGGFKKPSGFEGSKSSNSSSGPMKPSQSKRERGGKKSTGRDAEPIWGEKGSERAWDVGKGDDESSSEGEESEDSIDLESILIPQKKRSRKSEEFGKAIDDLFINESSTSSSSKSNKKKVEEEEKEMDDAIEVEERSWDLDEKVEKSKNQKKKEKAEKKKRKQSS